MENLEGFSQKGSANHVEGHYAPIHDHILPTREQYIEVQLRMTGERYSKSTLSLMYL
jgi:hypothetical protein